MDKILNAIKCHHCHKILSTPILLPCAHSMCKIHADKASDQVKCPKCGVSHKNQGFLINTELLEVIDSQIDSMDFGSCHKEAKDACDKLEGTLAEIYRIIKDPLHYPNEVIEGLKNKVLLKSEQLKFEIDENTEMLLAILTEYEKDCKLNSQNKNCGLSIRNLTKRGDETQEILNKSLEILKKFKIDESKWKSIKQECESKVDFLKEELQSFKKCLLMDEYEAKKSRVDSFLNIDLAPIFSFQEIFKMKDWIKQKMLRELCITSPQTKLKLLWRGSRDGFGAKDFHSRCDNISKTLTIIETTRGYVFGGYTEQLWNGTGWGADPNALIFSLANDTNSPLVMQIKDPDYAICRKQSFGPVFGYCHDICIYNNSNMSMANYSNIRSYFPPDNMDKNPHILAGSKNFQVEEIEVFQLE